MEIKEGLLYAKTHEWLKLNDDGTALVGLTDYAQSELGDLVFVNLPQAGDEVYAGESFADVESVKAVSDVMSPISGRVAEVNAELLDKPERINEAPYEAWLVKLGELSERSELMTAEEYGAFTQK